MKDYSFKAWSMDGKEIEGTGNSEMSCRRTASYMLKLPLVVDITNNKQQNPKNVHRFVKFDVGQSWAPISNELGRWLKEILGK